MQLTTNIEQGGNTRGFKKPPRQTGKFGSGCSRAVILLHQHRNEGKLTQLETVSSSTAPSNSVLSSSEGRLLYCLIFRLLRNRLSGGSGQWAATLTHVFHAGDSSDHSLSHIQSTKHLLITHKENPFHSKGRDAILRAEQLLFVNINHKATF